MREGLWQKFSSDDILKENLLDTGKKRIVEASPYDKIWGIGHSNYSPKLHQRDTWGQNLTGKALMETRDKLQKL